MDAKKKSKKENDIILFAVAENEHYNEEIGYIQPLLFLTYKKDWDKEQPSDYFTDFVHSALDAFGLEEYVEGVFVPAEDIGPMNSLDLAEVARSVGFIYSEDFEAKTKELSLD